MIFAFLTSRVGVIVIMGLVGIVAIYGYGTYVDGKARKEERAKTAELLAEHAQKARDEARAELDAERNAVSQASVALEDARMQFSAAQQRQATQFKAQMSAIDERYKKDTLDVLAVPVSDLPLAIRRQLAALRAGRQVSADGR